MVNGVTMAVSPSGLVGSGRHSNTGPEEPQPVKAVEAGPPDQADGHKCLLTMVISAPESLSPVKDIPFNLIVQVRTEIP